MPRTQNSIGIQIKKLREQRNMTQAILAARCGVLGWEISENGITKIEAQIRCVTEKELLVLAEALKVKLRDIYPNKSNLF